MRTSTNSTTRSRGRRRAWRTVGTTAAAMATLLPLAAIDAGAHTPGDPLHGGTGVGVTVVGHTDLGGAGLNGHVAVLGNYAYVGAGTNGGFAAQWNKTPTCKTSTSPVNTVKVVSLKDEANPTVVATINVDLPGNPGKTQVRDVAAIDVKPLFPGNVYTGPLLAVAKETCNANFDTAKAGVNFYNVSNPAVPVLVGQTVRTERSLNRFSASTREVSLVQRPSDGKVLALEANQQGTAFGGGIHLVDATNPAAPVTLGRAPDQAANSVPIQECRPFALPQGAQFNASGTRAYGAYQDGGLLVLDTADPTPGASVPILSQTKYTQAEEGNSFRFVPRGDELAALATDEDVNPAKTTLTITAGSYSRSYTEPGGTSPGVFRGCEGVWGSPLYKRATPSVSAEVKFVNGGGCQTAHYAGVDAVGKLVAVRRGGSLANGTICGFEDKARFAQAAGAIGVLIGNTTTDHHGGGRAVLFAPDSVRPVDANITIPVVNITKEAADAIEVDIQELENTVSATLADSAQTWGALRVFDLSGPAPTQTAVVNAPHTTTLSPGEGLYHAVNAVWKGNNVAVAWMSDGFRMVDLGNPNSPQKRAYYVPPAVADPSGNYGTVPLVVDVARKGDKFVVSDVNGGLYVLKVALTRDDCSTQGHSVVSCQALFEVSQSSPPPSATSPAGPGGDGTEMSDTTT